MEARTVSRNASDGIIRLHIDRPERRNALDALTIEALHEALDVPPAKEDRVLILSSAGSAFCAGMDLGEKAEGTDPQEMLEALLHKLEHYPLPTICRVQGPAMAGGMELALHADFVIASRAATMGLPLAKLGFVADWFLLHKLMEVCGPVVSRRIALVGEPIDAAEAHALGLIHLAVPGEALDATVEELASRLRANAPLSMIAMKRILLRLGDHRQEMGHADLDAEVLACRASRDRQEGILARRQKRPPAFRNE